MARPAVLEAVVVVTESTAVSLDRQRSASIVLAAVALIFGLLSLVVSRLEAAVLPEDRADVLYHSYDGGGVEIDGPSLLVRKSIGESFSVAGNYYVDTVSSASIDVLTTASPYDEERTQTSLGLDYLRGDTTLSLSFTSSEEDDYEASSVNFGIGQEVFGGMTTITLGFGLGADTVRRNGDNLFEDDVDRQHYRLGLSQVLTRNLLVGLNLETITDEGFLNNPYRSVRYADSDSARGYSYQSELYPRTRTSNAAAVNARYHLPYRAAVSLGYRYFTDDWEIDGHTSEIGYTQPVGAWTFDLKYRFYTQTAADFYSDLFPYENAQNFLARDKELSSFSSNTLRLGVSYNFIESGWYFLDKASVNFMYDHIAFDYDNFRNLSVGGNPGAEPLYSFDADVMQLFFSFWF